MGALQRIPTSRVRPNEHNPRLIFRGEELEELAESIQDIGVLVPISVFGEGKHYTLIDGERRWRACKMINLKEIPAIIYPKPSPLQNIVFMFNIHRFRKDWDPLPTAMKLEELKGLIEEEEGGPPTEARLSTLTGMSRGAIRRCKLIMEIPKRERDQVLRELEKPEAERRITTDLFVECQRAVRTIGQYLPDLEELEKPLRQSLVRKYKAEIIPNVTHMRMVAKIARAATKGAPKRTVQRVLHRLINDDELSVEDAYGQVAWVYDMRSVISQAKSLITLVQSLEEHGGEHLDRQTRNLLGELARRIRALLA